MWFIRRENKSGYGQFVVSGIYQADRLKLCME
jgi:hypothetical protein